MIESATLVPLLSAPEPMTTTLWNRAADDLGVGQAYNDPWVRVARHEQLPPSGDWRTWLFLAGRGSGKTRAAVEWIRGEIQRGVMRRVAVVAPTASDTRDVIVEGDSGFLSVCPLDFMPIYEPSKRRLTFPNGATVSLYSAEEPLRLRGPQFDGAWLDELCHFKYPETYDMLMFGLRLGRNPRCMITTTPRPTPLLKKIRTQSATVETLSTTYDNRANLASAFFTDIVSQYEGTRLGRQELLAEILDDTPGALWSLDAIDALRVSEHPVLTRVVVAIDPSVSDTATSHEAGIVAVGRGNNGHGYVLADGSTKGSPDTWMSKAIILYHQYEADKIIAEVNNGGDLIERLLHVIAPSIPYKKVHASRGKVTRAEPVAARYERKEIHHVGTFPLLEDQMCAMVPGVKSQRDDDRADALVWAITYLFEQPVALGCPAGIGQRPSPWKGAT